jgi:hypothetical protein
MQCEVHETQLRLRPSTTKAPMAQSHPPTQLHTHAHTRIHTTHKRARTRMHTHAHIRTHVHTHTHRLLTSVRGPRLRSCTRCLPSQQLRSRHHWPQQLRCAHHRLEKPAAAAAAAAAAVIASSQAPPQAPPLQQLPRVTEAGMRRPVQAGLPLQQGRTPRSLASQMAVTTKTMTTTTMTTMRKRK